MTFQVPSDFLADLLRLEREKNKVIALAESWGLDHSDHEDNVRESIKTSVKEASGL